MKTEKETNNEQLQMLKEMAESMEESIKNLDDVIYQQKELVKVLRESVKKDLFAEFIKGTEQQTIQTDESRKKLIERKGLIDFVCKCAESNEKGLTLVASLLRALGVFNS